MTARFFTKSLRQFKYYKKSEIITKLYMHFQIAINNTYLKASDFGKHFGKFA